MIVSINSFREEAFDINTKLDNLILSLDEAEVLGKAGLLNEDYEAILEFSAAEFVKSAKNSIVELIKKLKKQIEKILSLIKAHADKNKGVINDLDPNMVVDFTSLNVHPVISYSECKFPVIKTLMLNPCKEAIYKYINSREHNRQDFTDFIDSAKIFIHDQYEPKERSNPYLNANRTSMKISELKDAYELYYNELNNDIPNAISEFGDAATDEYNKLLDYIGSLNALNTDVTFLTSNIDKLYKYIIDGLSIYNKNNLKDCKEYGDVLDKISRLALSESKKKKSDEETTKAEAVAFDYDMEILVL